MIVMNRAIKYVGYYDAESYASENRVYVLAATHKMDYIIASLNKLGIAVQVVSASVTRNSRGYKGRLVSIGNGNELVLFPTRPWGGKARRVLSIMWSRMLLLSWLLANTSAGENVVVYHSLGYTEPLLIAKLIRRFRLILEVEEIYSDVTGRWLDRRKEDAIFRQADAFIFPTQMLNDLLNPENRPYVIVHGTYCVEAHRVRQWDDGRIHVVYAGTFDSRKGGGVAAAKAAKYLDARYHIHIIGFGSEADTRSLISVIEGVSAESECRVTYDGLLAGEDYLRFLQSCDIGLSTQKLDAAFSETSFPSKVLSYMASGLRVVTIRLKVLEHSGVGDLLYYYDEDTPSSIARAIKSIDFNHAYDGRSRLQNLDVAFQRDFQRMLYSAEELAETHSE